MYGIAKGTFGGSVKVEKSTLREHHAWLFVRNSDNGPVKGALHLSQEEAVELMEALSTFIFNPEQEPMY